MSEAAKPSPETNVSGKNVPDGLANGIIGFVLGAGVSFLALHFYGPREYITVPQPAGGPPGDNAPLTMPGSTPGAAPAGGSGSAKRNLALFVGKLELLSRDNLELHVKLDQDQATKMAAELTTLESAKSLTAEDAEARLKTLENLLAPQQKTAIDSIGLPFGRPGGGGPGAGMGESAPDANPFAQETNQKRLKDLLARLKPSNPDKVDAPEE